jgi:hypothetical protein
MLNSKAMALRYGTGNTRLAWQWIRCAHQEMASQLTQSLRGTGVRSGQLLILSKLRGTSVAEALELVLISASAQKLNQTVVADAPNFSVQSRHSGSLIRDLRRAALARWPSLQPSPQLPQGLNRLPPVRPEGFDWSLISGSRLTEAINVLESNSYPVSGPQYSHPADPLFVTWFKALESLGTRSLKMSEIQALISSDLSWAPGSSGYREQSSFVSIYRPNMGIRIPHELHKLVGGFRDQPRGVADVLAGHGGESGLFARVTVQTDGVNTIAWGEEGVIHDFWRQHQIQEDWRPMSWWEHKAQTLSSETAENVLKELKSLAQEGVFTDPRDQLTLRPVIGALLTSDPGSLLRIESADALCKFLRAKQQLLDTVSVSGCTAEIQMLETLSRCIAINKLDIRDPSHQLDAGKVYELYRDLLGTEQLTSRATVQRWLQEWGRSYVP